VLVGGFGCVLVCVRRVTELVLRPGTALDVPDFTGWTPLHIAMKTNQPDVVIVRVARRCEMPCR